MKLLDDQTQLEHAKLKRLQGEIEKGLASGDAEPLEMDCISAATLAVLAYVQCQNAPQEVLGCLRLREFSSP